HRPHRRVHQHARYCTARADRAGRQGDRIMSTVLTETPVLTQDQYAPLLGAAEVEELRTLAQPLEGVPVDMVNSTAVGGGVAEILNRILPLMRELGLEAHWHVMEGDSDFFDVTKAFHNALHGGVWRGGEAGFEVFRQCNRRNREKTR